MPLWQARRVDLIHDLNTAPRTGGAPKSRARGVLVVVQGALSVLLLIIAGLFWRSLANVKQLRLGYDVDPVSVVTLNMRGVKLDSARAAALRGQLLSAAQRIPEVEHAALRSSLPMWNYRSGQLDVPGIDSATRARLGQLYFNAVTPDYFAAMGTHLLQGRGIGPEDVVGAPGVIVVSSALAKLLWPHTSALGQCARVGGHTQSCSYVVGIAEDIKNTQLTGDPGLFYYVAAAQTPTREMGLVVRTRDGAARDAEVIRRALQKEMLGASYVTVTPFADIVGEQMQSWRLGVTVFGAFGVLATVLAAIGLYSVISYTVAQRTHELGVRMALGAGADRLVWMVVQDGMLLGGIGLVIGVAVAVAVSGQLAPLLFAVSPRDPLVYALVAALMLAVAAVASVAPAYRAARTDPIAALRTD